MSVSHQFNQFREPASVSVSGVLAGPHVGASQENTMYAVGTLVRPLLGRMGVLPRYAGQQAKIRPQDDTGITYRQFLGQETPLTDADDARVLAAFGNSTVTQTHVLIYARARLAEVNSLAWRTKFAMEICARTGCQADQLMNTDDVAQIKRIAGQRGSYFIEHNAYEDRRLPVAPPTQGGEIDLTESVDGTELLTSHSFATVDSPVNPVGSAMKAREYLDGYLNAHRQSILQTKATFSKLGLNFPSAPAPVIISLQNLDKLKRLKANAYRMMGEMVEKYSDTLRVVYKVDKDISQYPPNLQSSLVRDGATASRKPADYAGLSAAQRADMRAASSRSSGINGTAFGASVYPDASGFALAVNAFIETNLAATKPISAEVLRNIFANTQAVVKSDRKYITAEEVVEAFDAQAEYMGGIMGGDTNISSPLGNWSRTAGEATCAVRNFTQALQSRGLSRAATATESVGASSYPNVDPISVLLGVGAASGAFTALLGAMYKKAKDNGCLPYCNIPGKRCRVATQQFLAVTSAILTTAWAVSAFSRNIVQGARAGQESALLAMSFTYMLLEALAKRPLADGTRAVDDITNKVVNPIIEQITAKICCRQVQEARLTPEQVDVETRRFKAHLASAAAVLMVGMGEKADYKSALNILCIVPVVMGHAYRDALQSTAKGCFTRLCGRRSATNISGDAAAVEL